MSLNLLIITSKSHIEAILIITMGVTFTHNLLKPNNIMSSCLEFINRLRVNVIHSMIDKLEKNIRFKTRCKFYPFREIYNSRTRDKKVIINDKMTESYIPGNIHHKMKKKVRFELNGEAAEEKEEEIEGGEEEIGPPPQFVHDTTRHKREKKTHVYYNNNTNNGRSKNSKNRKKRGLRKLI